MRCPTRRSVIASGLSLAGTALLSPAWAQDFPQTAIQASLGDGQKFDGARISDLARVLAKKAFIPPQTNLPDPFKSLTYNQYVGIKSRPGTAIWNNEGRGFTIEPLPRGFVFVNPVDLFTVEDGVVHRIGYDAAKFDFGAVNLPAKSPDIGFSGFRLFALGNGNTIQETAIFQGANFFRCLARGQNFGTMARTLTLRAGESKGEEIPIFRAFWIERPNAGTGTIIIHALIDSESVVGAVRFTLRASEITIVDIEATLFPRVTLDHVGIGGLSATYLYGPNDRNRNDDIREAVYEAMGLQILNGNGEWIWRPLNNPSALQISAFVDMNPKGFGLIQRNREFSAFEDDDQHWEKRPTVWVEPLGDWGEGSVQLIEIPSNSDVNDNVIAYWRPRAPYPAGSETRFALRQFWCWTPPETPDMAIVTQTRTGRGSRSGSRRFIVDFSGEGLAETKSADGLKPILSVKPGSVRNVQVWRYPGQNTVRIGFELDHGDAQACELRLQLENDGKPISETWLYRWTP